MGERGPKPLADKKTAVSPVTTTTVAISTSHDAEDPPPHPAQIGSDAQELWFRLWDSPLSAHWDRTTDLFILQRYIRYADQWLRIIHALQDTGEFLAEGSMGQPVEHPLLKMARQLESHLQSLEDQLGLTPLARARLGLTKASGELTARQLNGMVERLLETDLTATPTTTPGIPDDIEQGWEAD